MISWLVGRSLETITATVSLGHRFASAQLELLVLVIGYWQFHSF